MRIKDSLQQARTERRITEQGYLVVPANLSKVGLFRYRESELIKDGSADIKTVARTEHSLFTPDTIQSFENAPITITHPNEDVTAKNWKALSVGFVRNVRRDGDYLKGDAWVTDEAAIKAIQDNGLVEISCGYDAEILPVKDGADYEFAPMKGNHVALVPAGRCGSDVKIHDEDTITMDEKEQLESMLDNMGQDGVMALMDKILAETDYKKDDDASNDEEAPTEEPQGDEQVEEKAAEAETTDLQAENAQLKAQIAELQQKLKELQDAQDEVEAENTEAQVRDFMPDFVARGAKSAREVKRQALVKAGTHNIKQVARLTDAALDASFDVMKALKGKPANKSNLGKGIKDSALGVGVGGTWGGNVDLNKLYGGK